MWMLKIQENIINSISSIYTIPFIFIIRVWLEIGALKSLFNICGIDDNGSQVNTNNGIHKAKVKQISFDLWCIVFCKLNIDTIK
jgi:hypothetical protein